MSILKLLDGNGYIDSGTITFKGRNLAECTINDMYQIRGNEISVIFQEPMTSLNPVYTIEKQLNEVYLTHQKITKKEASEKSLEMLKAVKIPNPESVMKQFPHQLSGGMRQRVMIAMALACEPSLLIADEPTTALDVTIQAQILKLMNELKKEKGTSILFITHDLGVVAKVAEFHQRYVRRKNRGKRNYQRDHFTIRAIHIPGDFFPPCRTWIRTMRDCTPFRDPPPNLLHEKPGDAFATP